MGHDRYGYNIKAVRKHMKEFSYLEKKKKIIESIDNTLELI